LVRGRSYEWSIFGAEAGIIGESTLSGGLYDEPTNAPYFYRIDDAAGDAEAYSFGSISSYGLGAINGFYIFTIADNAEDASWE
jgi:hypothetical protein